MIRASMCAVACDRLGPAEPPCDSAEEFAEIIFNMMQRLSSHAQGDTGEFGGHDTYSRRFVELLCMPRTLHSGLRGFSMTLLAGSISIQRSSLNYCECMPP